MVRSVSQPDVRRKVAGLTLHSFLQRCTPVVFLAEIFQIGHLVSPENPLITLNEFARFPGCSIFIGYSSGH